MGFTNPPSACRRAEFDHFVGITEMPTIDNIRPDVALGSGQSSTTYVRVGVVTSTRT
jgi:hypothetical protein